MTKLGIFAGHRGKGTGAVVYDSKLKNVVFDEGAEALLLTNEIVTRLSLKGFDNVVTDGITESLSHLVARLSKEMQKDDISLDVHFNWFGDESAHGVEVIIPKRYTAKEKAIATELADNVAECLGIYNRGIKTEEQSQHHTLAMLSSFDCNNLLIEMCFITNKADVKAYRAKKGEVAEVIADTLLKYVR